ncbi:MAG: hypothetical protein GF334_03490 [Candidatus Altiarchaeales archaeon]|nr:hypothetical protein [Candidatus Altiarchaeales archaeon]
MLIYILILLIRYCVWLAEADDLKLIKCNKGLTGFSALIVLVALMLAAITAAAAVFMTTGELNTAVQGKNRPDDVQFEQAIVVEQVMARDTDSDKKLDEIDFIIRYGRGNNRIYFNDTIIYAQSSVTDCPEFEFGASAGNCNYSLTYFQRGTKWRDYTLSEGDIARLRVTNVTSVEDRNAIFKFVPETGMIAHIQIDFPKRIMGSNYQVWPVK